MTKFIALITYRLKITGHGVHSKIVKWHKITLLFDFL